MRSDLQTKKTQETCKAKQQEIWLHSCFLVWFHAVHQDGSDPSFSSITQRFSSERELVPKGLNGCRKALSAGQRGQEHGQASACSLHCQFSSLQQFTGNLKPINVKMSRPRWLILLLLTYTSMSYMSLGWKCCLNVHNYMKSNIVSIQTADSSSENIVIGTLRLKSKKGL